ncbi:MAG: 6,7-dimethyl-8-ribityllumazine synthase [Mycoplasma sp.]|nr:6,7-dimethyl-8-ribityllumazine synthase [Mycoplasma sp.]
MKQNQKVLVINANFIEKIGEKLKTSTIDQLKSDGFNSITTIDVPGMWEVPFTLNHFLSKDKDIIGVIVIGSIIGGKTTVYAKNMSRITREKMVELSIKYNTPVMQGVIEAETIDDVMVILKTKNRNDEGKFAAKSLYKLLNNLQNKL